MHYSMVTVRSATARLAVVGVVAASMALGVGYTAGGRTCSGAEYHVGHTVQVVLAVAVRGVR